MLTDVELPRVITQNHGIAQEFVRLNAAPQRTLGGDPDRLGRFLRSIESQAFGVLLQGCVAAHLRPRFGSHFWVRGFAQSLLSAVDLIAVSGSPVESTGAHQ